MTIELGLLLLESVLLITTVVLLGYSIYKGKQRDNLLREMSRAKGPDAAGILPHPHGCHA